MKKITYHNKQFRSISNSENGEVDGKTIFHYMQDGDIVCATYQGGGIRLGSLIAKVGSDGKLDMRYQHININEKIMTGTCRSTPELLEDGRIRLKEKWQWTCGDCAEGESVIEEIPD